jgi:hypothetical protein
MGNARNVVYGVVGAVLVLTLGACSSSKDSDPRDASSRQAPSGAVSEGSRAAAQTAFTPRDVAEPGEEQLGNIRLGKVFAGAVLKSSWKFPTSYEPVSGDNGRAYSKDKHFRISIEAGTGDQTRAAAALASAQRQADAKGQKTSLHTVTIKGREFAALVQDTPAAAILTYAHAPAGDSTFYIVQLATDRNLADVPKDQLAAFEQTLGSLEFERG